MIVVLGDLLADFALGVPSLDVDPRDLHQVTFIDLGPGGAGNVAIMAARLGLDVAAMGEVGDDRFGEIVREGLAREGVATHHLLTTPEARTPVATVLVDRRGEPAYLGYPGRLALSTLAPGWRSALAAADALYFDGWAEHPGAVDLLLDAQQVAVAAGVPVFFDPGPGNPHVDNDWHRTAAAAATVVLATEEEAARVVGIDEPLAAGAALLAGGAARVVVKRGADGLWLLAGNEVAREPGLAVTAVDATGAGDSLAAAVIWATLRGLSPADTARLANATGAAKVRKRGTGHNVPTRAEIAAVLAAFGHVIPGF